MESWGAFYGRGRVGGGDDRERNEKYLRSADAFQALSCAAPIVTFCTLRENSGYIMGVAMVHAPLQKWKRNSCHCHNCSQSSVVQGSRIPHNGGAVPFLCSSEAPGADSALWHAVRYASRAAGHPTRPLHVALATREEVVIRALQASEIACSAAGETIGDLTVVGVHTRCHAQEQHAASQQDWEKLHCHGGDSEM